MRILVADDGATTRRLLCSIVTMLGHEPVEAVDGNETWRVLQSDDAPRLALLDWMMPDLDGVELCRRLRAEQRGQSTYIILVTGRTDTEDVVEGLASGANDFISKPSPVAVLAAKINAGLRMVALQDEAVRTRAYLTATLEAMEVGAILSDASQRIVFASPAMERLSGTPLSQTVGQLRAEYVAQHRPRFASQEAFDEVVRVNALPARGVPGTFAFNLPRRQLFRWHAVPVDLPGGAGRLDVYRDVTEDADRIRREKSLARVDPLTGIANRRGGEEFLDREWERSRRHGPPLSVVIFDIDHFKRVNDGFGHATGDAVIRTVALALAGQLRATDLAVRWGGEELLAVLPDTPTDGARVLAERVRESIAAIEKSAMPRVTVSGGLATITPEDARVETLVDRADANLYRAKEAGRNRVE